MDAYSLALIGAGAAAGITLLALNGLSYWAARLDVRDGVPPQYLLRLLDVPAAGWFERLAMFGARLYLERLVRES